jgi:hypothetical protein
MAKMRYTAGDASAVRKHEYMPCILVARQEDFSPEEWVVLMKRCYYADYFTVAEWRAIVSDGQQQNRSVKSKLKRKVTGWLMAMGRLGAIKRDWLTGAMLKATEEYQELTGADLRQDLVSPLVFPTRKEDPFNND